MVKLEIIPTHETLRDCFEDSIASIALSFRQGCELLFSRAWDFNFAPELLATQTLGNSIQYPNNTPACLAKYYGIIPKPYQTKDTDGLIELIKSELLNGRPVIVRIDVCGCPWLPEYRTEVHRHHSCVISGFNDNEAKFYATDPYFVKDSLEFPFTDFKNAYMEYTFFFTIQENYGEIDNWQDLLRDTLNNVNRSGSNPNIFTMIQNFAETAKTNLDFEKEFPDIYNNNTVWIYPLYSNLNNAARRRMQFIGTLQFLANKFDNKNLTILAKKFQRLFAKWSMVTSLIVKGAYQRKADFLVKEISDRLMEIAKDEEELANLISQMIKSEDFVIEWDDSILVNEIKISEITYLDLKDAMNNKGFGDYRTGDCQADFTGMGEYILTDGIPLDSILQVNTMRFQLSPIQNDMNDNISCTGQVINVAAFASGMMFLGCSEWGSFSGDVIINYENGTNESFSLELTDWYLSKPLFEDTMAWSVQTVKRSNVIVKEVRYLYAQYHPLKQNGFVASITLPNCPNMHLFAISVGK